MAEARTFRLRRTAVGIVVGFLLMGAAVGVAYQGLSWVRSEQRILGIIVLLVVGPLVEVCTHLLGIKTTGLGRGILMGIFASMVVGGRFVAKSGGGVAAAVLIPLFVFFSALFTAWVRESVSLRKEM